MDYCYVVMVGDRVSWFKGCVMSALGGYFCYLLVGKSVFFSEIRRFLYSVCL